jgi:hypothetical protein
VTDEARARHDKVVGAGEAQETPWGQYVGLLRELDALRVAEQARSANRRQAVAGMDTRVDRLEGFLHQQGERLVDLGERLKVRRPALTPIPVKGEVEVNDALQHAADAAQRASRNAEAAEHKARQAVLLPRWSFRARNLVIYLFWACVGLVAQYQLFVRSGPDGPPFLVVFGIVPLAALLAGLLTVRVLGRVRIPPERLHRSGPARAAHPMSVLLGVLVCWCTGLLVFLAISFHDRLGF